MEKDEKAGKDIANIAKLKAAFRHVQDRYTKYITVPRYVSVTDIQAKYRLAESQICNAVNASQNFRVRNLASAVPVDEKPVDKLVIETFPLNTPYGCCIDRGSKVTIVATSNVSEAATGTFAYYLAKIGGFNYVSKEIELDVLNPVTYYNIVDEHADENLSHFLDDINRLANAEDHWVIFILAASGGQEPEYLTQFHYVIGKAKGDETYNDPRITIKDIQVFDALYKDLSESTAQQFDLQSDCQKYHTGTSPKNIARHIACPNAFTIRIAWSVLCWDYRYLQIAQTMAKSIRKHMAINEPEHDLSDIISRQEGKDCGYDD
jgi:voltage-gated potassium channel